MSFALNPRYLWRFPIQDNRYQVTPLLIDFLPVYTQLSLTNPKQPTGPPVGQFFCRQILLFPDLASQKVLDFPTAGDMLPLDVSSFNPSLSSGEC
ncbi:hypothetical protein Q31a_17510 [Aureliella helgolandensis]|uniref:Uncharacterized protein n=1 Tax=Aureliella helgolandensis TaxID=2527968 RepID=A0A518G4C6_9BACT|nr:hypothetical protein Q31a_17510 [Aureliella helgolandensis]